MRCVLCDQKKGKRSCPAKSALICPQCCGEKRVLEVDCPESCEYLKSGRSREIADYVSHLHSMDLLAQRRNERVLGSYREVIAHLEYWLSHERLLSKELCDKDVAQALELLLENYRTEEKGILYEKTSDDLKIDYLRRELRKIVESYRNPEREGDDGIIDPQQERLPLKAAIDCLEFIRDMLASYMKERTSPTRYIDILARIATGESRDTTKSSIIIP